MGFRLQQNLMTLNDISLSFLIARQNLKKLSDENVIQTMWMQH